MAATTSRITTLTGSVYEFALFPEPDENNFIGVLRRVPAADGGAPSAPMRRDEEPLGVYRVGVLETGKPAVFLLQGLGQLPFTVRTTSIVQTIEQVA